MNENRTIEELKALDELKDNTRISKYVFTIGVGFLLLLFGTYFVPHPVEGTAPLLNDNLIHLITGAVITWIGVMVDRYFKQSNGNGNGHNNGMSESDKRALEILKERLREQNEDDEE